MYNTESGFWRRWGWIGFLAASLVPTVLGQHTEAVCNITSLSWTFNSLGQSPCLVAAYLSNPCSSNGDFDIPSIGPGLHYTPPDIPALCTCSSVTYSVLSACASCQEADIGAWTEYTENCTHISPDGQYGFAIPPGTAVPNWAYQLVTGSNRFNLTIAQAAGDKPENVTAPATSTTSTSPGTTLPASPDQTSGPSSPKSSSGKNNAAIIGGAVGGGVGGLAIIGGLLAFCLISKSRKKAAEPAPSVAYFSNYERPVSHYTANMPPSPDPTKLGNEVNTPTSPGYGYSQPSPMPIHGGGSFGRPYNPDDPSTFPSPLPGAGHGDPDRIVV